MDINNTDNFRGLIMENLRRDLSLISLLVIL